MKFDTRWYGSERYALKVANRMLRSGKYTRANVRPLRRSPMTGAPIPEGMFWWIATRQ